MAVENVSLRDALSNVETLNAIETDEDLPVIEALGATLEYRANFDTNFEDRSAFVTGCSKYIEEATRHGEFNEMLKEGFQHAGNLYTWRCCSRAVPMAKSNDQPNRTEINEKVAQVLQPEMEKLYRFMLFCKKATSRFCEEVRRLCHPEKRKDFVSESYLLVLGKFLNMFAILDELKNMKASIKNDFSTYKRASQFLQNISALTELQELSLFLATQNKIKEQLKADLGAIEGYEELLADVINICVYFYETQMYVSPDEKHMYVKVIAFSLFLMDASMSFVAKMDQKKRISIQKLDKIFKSVEVVPLFGDMQIQPFSFVKRSQFYDSSKWPLSNVEAEHCHVHVVEKVRAIREHHDAYVTHLARLKIEISVYDKEGPRTDAENREIARLTLSGIQLLCSWTCDVVETISWKLLHPTNSRDNPSCPENAESYERATRYNYSPEEKAALVEIISMIKDVQLLIGKMEPEFSLAIRRHIYAELQDFVHITIREPLQKALKNKKDMMSGIINSIIDTCADNDLNNFNRSSDLSLKVKKKKSDAQSMTDLRMKRRHVAPSSTQLYLARTMMESLIPERACTGRRKDAVRKDIDKVHLEKMIHFHRISFDWPALLRLPQTLEQCCDLSQMWFREFYLEMTNGERIQFPIEMSVPWILTDHILTAQDPSLLECALYQLDLYNDAANFALRKFQKQFLYEEVEAEVNLCFDQFIYKLSEAVFTHYKQLAACMLLDKGFKADCGRLGISIRTPPAARFESLLKQRHLQLLGRSIDLNRLITQRINVAIQRSLDVAISKFESEGLEKIMSLEQLLEVNRLCHRLLKEHLHSLADFEDLFVETNHQVNTPNGRITLHVYVELSGELVPNYCYNSVTHRFVRSKVLFRRPPEREKAPIVAYPYEFGSKSLNAAFSNICAMYHGFIGMPHMKVIAKILGYQGIAAILEELLGLSRTVINDQLKPHIRILLSLAPKVCKLPRYDYGAEAVLQYYLHHVKDVSVYAPLKKEFCQALRELGNILTFTNQLELSLAQEEMLDLLSAAAFTNVIPKPPAKNLEEQEVKMKRLEAKYSRIQIAAVVQQHGIHNEGEIARDSELLTKERLCCGLNVFEKVLGRIRDVLATDSIWRGTNPPNNVMWVDECVEFHRVWSAAQFALCVAQLSPADPNGIPSIEECFGDSIWWAACALISLLGQHRRFEVLDFSYHLMRVFRAEPRGLQATVGKEAQAQGPVQLMQLIERIRRVQSMNNQLFAILANYTQQAQDEFVEGQVREFAPPVHPRAALHNNHKSDEYGTIYRGNGF